jgi:hypothetical protein
MSARHLPGFIDPRVVAGKILTPNDKPSQGRVYADRSADNAWMELSDFVDLLPYPAAYPLARFLSETTPDQMDRWGEKRWRGCSPSQLTLHSRSTALGAALKRLSSKLSQTLRWSAL